MLVEFTDPVVDRLKKTEGSINLETREKERAYWFELKPTINLGISCVPTNRHATSKNEVFVLLLTEHTSIASHLSASWLRA